MAYVWKPAIWHSDFGGATDIYQLPQAVVQLDPSWTWKFAEHEVPRKDGGETHGLSQRPVDIGISGVFGLNASGATVGEAAMWTEFTTLKSKLEAADDAEQLELFLYHDPSSGTYVKLKEVIPVALTPNIGDTNHTTFGYSLQLRAMDPTIYTTAAGS